MLFKPSTSDQDKLFYGTNLLTASDLGQTDVPHASTYKNITVNTLYDAGLKIKLRSNIFTYWGEGRVNLYVTKSE